MELDPRPPRWVRWTGRPDGRRGRDGRRNLVRVRHSVPGSQRDVVALWRRWGRRDRWDERRTRRRRRWRGVLRGSERVVRRGLDQHGYARDRRIRSTDTGVVRVRLLRPRQRLAHEAADGGGG